MTLTGGTDESDELKSPIELLVSHFFGGGTCLHSLAENSFVRKTSFHSLKMQNSVVTVPFLTALLLGKLFSDMVSVVDCRAGVLGLNPGKPKTFSPWNYFTGGSGNSVRHFSRPLGVVAGYTQLWLMLGSQEIKGGRV